MAAKRSYSSLLKHAQQIGLQNGVQFANLIQENRSAMCGSKTAKFLGTRICVSPSHMAEEMAAKERLRNGWTIDCDKGFVGAIALTMNFARLVLYRCHWAP